MKDSANKLTVSKELEEFKKKKEDSYIQLEKFDFEYTNPIKNTDFLYNFICKDTEIVDDKLNDENDLPLIAKRSPL